MPECAGSKKSLVKLRQAAYSRWNETVSPATTIETMLISLIRMFSDGPDVSLNGSPTVSPTTVALWLSDPLRCPRLRPSWP